MSEEKADQESFDSIVASVSSKVTSEQVEEAKRVSQALSESPSAFGPVVMFALDKI
ncbi:hypothetical protein [Streptomyces milbemycinicus]|uniref:Uncharacterized protein n=1 Tax=Streptomyces milbemycinicus TaxID=476552 RepID=A0ABW8LK31_9ACTN